MTLRSILHLAPLGALAVILCGCPRGDTAVSDGGDHLDGGAPSADVRPLSQRGEGGVADAETAFDASSVEVGGGALPTLVRIENARRMSRPVFERLVSDPDVLVRRRALLALARMGRAEGLAPLRTALGDEDERARQLALFAIGQLDASAHRDAETVLNTFLGTDPTPADRRAAVLALGKVGSLESQPALLEALESPEPRLRAAGAKALGLLAMRGTPPSEPPVAALVPRLDDTDAEVRLAAAFALSRGLVPSAPTLEAVSSALEKRLVIDPEVEVRIMAGRALAHLGVSSPNAALSILEGHEEWRVRTSAGNALGQGAPPEKSARALASAWSRIREDPSRLTSSDLHPLVGLLDAAASEPAPRLGKALRVIHRDMGKLLGEPSLDPRQRLALAQLRCRAALAIDLPRERPGLVSRCAEAPDGSSSLEPWEVATFEARAWSKSARPQAMGALAKLARHEDERVRLAAIESVETLTSQDRLAPIERALDDRSEAVVATAADALLSASALFEVQERPEEQLSVTEYTSEGPVLHELRNEAVKAPPIPVDPLLKALKRANPDNDVETVINLLKVAGRLKIQELAEPALELARHHNPTVRAEARRALVAMGRDPGVEIATDPPNLIDPADMERLARERPRVMFRTSAGDFVIELRPDLAPATVANMIALVRSGFYRDIRFHRVVPGFVAQVGDPTGTGFGGPGYTIRCEVSEEPYRRGSVGMALAGPDTGGSQFFITYSAQPHLDSRYTLFGQVVEGLEVVESIQAWDHITEAHLEGELPATQTETGRVGD